MLFLSAWKDCVGSSEATASTATPSPGVEVIQPQIAPESIIQLILTTYLPMTNPIIMAATPKTIARNTPVPESDSKTLYHPLQFVNKIFFLIMFSYNFQLIGFRT